MRSWLFLFLFFQKQWMLLIVNQCLVVQQQQVLTAGRLIRVMLVFLLLSMLIVSAAAMRAQKHHCYLATVLTSGQRGQNKLEDLCLSQILECDSAEERGVLRMSSVPLLTEASKRHKAKMEKQLRRYRRKTVTIPQICIASPL